MLNKGRAPLDAAMPRRPIRVAPVFSNLPAPSVGRSTDHHHLRIGLFTYSHTEPVAPLVLEAILFFVDPAGPTARRGSLAASLASGTPVVAIDGPDCWSELRLADAARIVSPTPSDLAGAIKSLAAEEAYRRALGERGRAFAGQQMGIARTVGALTALLDAAAAGA